MTKFPMENPSSDSGIMTKFPMAEYLGPGIMINFHMVSH